MTLLGLLANTSVSLQILIKSTLVQAQTTANPAVKPVVWQDTGLLGGPSYPDVQSACEAYRKAYIDYTLFDYAVLIPPIEPVISTTTVTFAGAQCNFEVGITDLGQYLDDSRVVDAVCLDAPDGSTYIYTGGLNGECRLSVDNSSNNPTDYQDTSLGGIKTIPFETESPVGIALDIISTPIPLNPVELPQNDAQTKHIFRDDEGHLPDTPENRDLLIKTASDEENYLGTDIRGNKWYAKTNPDGSQTWVETRNNIIRNGGLNGSDKTRVFDPQKGLIPLK